MTKTYGNFTDFVDFSRASGGTALRRVSYGPELVTNGTFDTDITGWTSGAGSITVSSGQVTLANDTAAISDIRQTVSVTAGKVYVISFDFVAKNSASIRVSIDSASYQYTGGLAAENIQTPSSYSVSFVATGSSAYIRLMTNSTTVGHSTTWDNISVKEVTFDQSSGDLVLFNHPNNIPRVEYDANGVVKGLLIEEQRTNGLWYSESINTSPWILNGDSVALSGNSFLGIPTWTVTSSTATGVYQNVTLTASDWTISVIAKAGTTDTIRVRFGSPLGLNADFDLSTGDVTYSDVGVTATSTALGDGYYKLQVTTTATAASTGIAFYAVGGSIEIVAPQIEQGSFPTSHIPTTGATATRAADIASIATSNFGYNQKAGTVVVEAIPTRQLAGTMVNICDSGSGGTIERMQLRFQSTTVQAIFASSGVADGSSTTGHSLSVGDTTTGAFTFKGANTLTTAQAGTVGTTDTSHLVPTPVELRVGRLGATEFLNGHIKSIKYLPRRLTNTQLQEQTA